jgi:hypothetical protein
LPRPIKRIGVNAFHPSHCTAAGRHPLLNMARISLAKAGRLLFMAGD